MNPHQFGLDFWDLLLLPNAGLVEHGVPADHATKLRMSFTGHQRPLSPSWMRTIGCWGRTEMLDTIAEHAGKTRAQAKSYGAKRGLRAATKKHRRTQAQLAAGLYFDRERVPTESCRWWGVLPVERVLLLASFQEMLDSHGVTPLDALRWEPTELLLRWKDSGVGLEAPLERLPPGGTSAANAHPIPGSPQ